MTDDPLIGRVICDRFEIRAKLGQGGMGTVYRAWQRSVRREVAIKLIEPRYSRDPMAVQRFEREAQLASQLSQPTTVSVLDFGQTEDGQLFIAMELLRGRTLYRVLCEDGVLPIDRAVRIAVQICDALEAAHALGIVHRDLKLENVMVLDHPPGRDLLKVLDFGLAKLAGDHRGTAQGIVMGTPRYMAPETVSTGVAVPVGDMYSLGVMLTELTSGTSPWNEPDLAKLLTLKLDPTPALAAVPAPLKAVIAALIEPDPSKRATPAQARALLEAVTPVRRRRRWPYVVLGAALAGAAATVIAVAIASGGEPAVGLAPADARGVRRDEARVAGSANPAIAPDAAAVEVEEVEVEITTAPAVDFEIWERGRFVAPGPGRVKIKRSHRRHLSIRALGYRDREVLVDGSGDVVIPLETTRDCRESLLDPRDPRCRRAFCAAHEDDLRCGVE